MTDKQALKAIAEIKAWAIAKYGEDTYLSKQILPGALLTAGWRTELKRLLDQADAK